MFYYCALGTILLLLCVLWRYTMPLTRRRISLLLRDSHILYSKKQFAESLDVALEAAQLARSQVGGTSNLHVRTLMVLAAVYAAMPELDKALGTLDEAETLVQRTHGEGSLSLVPVLHARAGVLETTGSEGAIEVLDRVRDIHRSKRGAQSLDYGYSCFNQASAVVRHANDSPDMQPEQRAALVDRAVALTFEAYEAADASFDAHQGDEFAEAVLELIKRGGAPNRLGAIPECQASIQKLQEHLKEHFEYFGAEGRSDAGDCLEGDANRKGKEDE